MENIDFSSIVSELKNFASPDFIDLVGTLAIYSPLTADISYPTKILINNLRHYVSSGIFSSSTEQQIVDYLKTDYLSWLEKEASDWHNLHPIGSKLNSLANNVPAIKPKDDMGPFRPLHHVAMIGSTNAGKTTYFIKMLLQNRFPDFDQFVFIETGIKPETTQNVLKAAAYAMRIQQGKPKHSKEFVYYKVHELKDALRHCTENDNSLKKLVFLDDAQVQSRGTEFDEVTKFISVAKNANCQVVLTMHWSHGDKTAKTLRDAVGYFVMMNVTLGTFNSIMELKGSDNPYWKRYIQYTSKYERVIIYDKEERKMFNWQYGSFIPLIDPSLNMPPDEFKAYDENNKRMKTT
jgi:hypothetical protein